MFKATKMRKPLPTILLVLVLIWVSITPVNSATQDTHAYNKQEIARQLQMDYLRQNEKEMPPHSLDMTEIDCNLEEKYSALIQEIRQTPSSPLWNHFVNAQTNEKGGIIIYTNCTDDDCYTLLKNKLPECQIVLAKNANPLFPTEQLYDDLNKKLCDLNTRVLEKKSLAPLEKKLIALYPAVQIEGIENQIVVSFSEEANKNSLNKEAYLHSCKQLFEQAMGSPKVDQYLIVPEKELLFDPSASNVMAGMAAYVVHSNTSASGISLGFRAKKTISGTTRYGFVSCAHGAALHKDVFLSNPFHQSVYFGKVIAIKNQGIVDASFIELQNSNYILTPAIAGMNKVISGGTLPAVDTVLHKVGISTGHTQGSIINVYGSGYFDNVYHYRLIKVNSKIVDDGDSGGIAYINLNNGTSKAAGIVLGYGSSTSFFIRYESIINELGLSSY